MKRKGDENMQMRRLAGLAMGALFLGSTLAAAVTLGDFPAPFVQDGQVKGLVVVGANAQPADVVAAINLAARLGSEAWVERTVTVPGSSGGDVAITGNGVPLDTPGSRLYLGDALNAVKQTLTGKDLPSVLGKRTFQDDAGTSYDYSQYLDVGGNQIQYLQPDTDMEPVYAVQMSTNSAQPLYTLRAVFNKQIDFTNANVVGKTIELFGKEFTVSSETTATKLVLLGSSQEITINMGEEKTVEVGGQTYTIRVLGFDTANDKVVLSVNGGAADEIQEGTSKKINGLQIYAKLVTSWDNGNQGLATLQLGSEKYIFENGQEVRVGDNEDPIDGTLVTMDNPNALTNFQVAVFAPDSDHDLIELGGQFVDPVFGSVRVAFPGMSEPSDAETRELIRFRNSGDYKGYVEFTDSLGNRKTVYFAYVSGSPATLYLQDSSQKNIYVVEGVQASEDEYVFLAPLKSADNTQDTAYTHLVRVRRIYADDDNIADDYAEFEDVLTGAVYKTQTFDYDEAAPTVSTDLTVDGKTYTVTFGPNDGDSTTDPTWVKVTRKNPGSYIVVYPAIQTENGADLALTDDVDPTGGTTNDLGSYASNIAYTATFVLPTGKLQFRVNDTGSATFEYSVDGGAWTSLPSSPATITIGNVDYTVTYSTSDGASAGDATLDISKIQVSTITNPAVLLVEEEDNANARNAVIVQTTISNGKLEFATPILTASTKYAPVSTSDSDKTRGVDVWGTEYLYDQSATDHAVVDLWYPDNQVYFGLAVLEEGASASMGGAVQGGTITYREPQPVTSEIALLDTEADAYKTTTDLILVGGTTVNSLVRELAENGKLPEVWDGSAWTLNPGEAIIKIVEDAWAQGHVALVVAGTEAADTAAAVRVLQQYDQHADDLAGKTTVKVVNGVVTDVA